MRLIDADALIGELHNYAFLEGDDRAIAYNIIQKQPTINQWIPVSERLPKEGKEVQVTSGFEEPWIYVTDGKFSSRFGGWVSSWDNQPLCDVTAWMPLPKPYKEGNDEVN